MILCHPICIWLYKYIYICVLFESRDLGLFVSQVYDETGMYMYVYVWREQERGESDRETKTEIQIR